MVVKIKTLNTEFDCIGGAVVAEGDRSTGVLLYYCLLHNGWLTQPGGAVAVWVRAQDWRPRGPGFESC